MKMENKKTNEIAKVISNSINETEEDIKSSDSSDEDKEKQIFILQIEYNMRTIIAQNLGHLFEREYLSTGEHIYNPEFDYKDFLLRCERK